VSCCSRQSIAVTEGSDPGVRQAHYRLASIKRDEQLASVRRWQRPALQIPWPSIGTLALQFRKLEVMIITMCSRPSATIVMTWFLGSGRQSNFVVHAGCVPSPCPNLSSIGSGSVSGSNDGGTRCDNWRTTVPLSLLPFCDWTPRILYNLAAMVGGRALDRFCACVFPLLK
jgi:hypothetical protein